MNDIFKELTFFLLGFFSAIWVLGTLAFFKHRALKKKLGPESAQMLTQLGEALHSNYLKHLLKLDQKQEFYEINKDELN